MKLFQPFSAASPARGNGRTDRGNQTRPQKAGCFKCSELVLPERFELSASPLPRECSTPELRQHRAAFYWMRRQVQELLSAALGEKCR